MVFAKPVFSKTGAAKICKWHLNVKRNQLLAIQAIYKIGMFKYTAIHSFQSRMPNFVGVRMKSNDKANATPRRLLEKRELRKTNRAQAQQMSSTHFLEAAQKFLNGGSSIETRHDSKRTVT